jgi:hypothetical protein
MANTHAPATASDLLILDEPVGGGVVPIGSAIRGLVGRSPNRLIIS